MSIQTKEVISALENIAEGEQLRAAVGVANAAPSIVLSHYGGEIENLPAQLGLDPGSEIGLLEGITREGYDLAESRYGTGWPQYIVCEQGVNLGYNNGHHARDFSADSRRLNVATNGSRIERLVYQMVGAWHDVVQTSVVEGLPRLGQDEQESAEQLVRRLREQHVAPAIATVAAYGIIGTWPVVNKLGKVVGQWGAHAPDEYYPSEDTKRAARHAAANDLGRLYDPIGPFSALMLYAQRQGKSPYEEPVLDGMDIHLQGQIAFLTDHEYPVKEANQIFTALKKEVIGFNEKLLKQTESGLSWQSACLQALDFARKHGAVVPEDLYERYAFAA
jgi:hypothetical protein